MGVCVINLLALLGKNKDIIDIAKSSFWVNFDQAVMGIYFDSSASGVILIAFD